MNVFETGSDINPASLAIESEDALLEGKEAGA
jgi:hypothetical protein